MEGRRRLFFRVRLGQTTKGEGDALAALVLRRIHQQRGLADQGDLAESRLVDGTFACRGVVMLMNSDVANRFSVADGPRLLLEIGDQLVGVKVAVGILNVHVLLARSEEHTSELQS